MATTALDRTNENGCPMAGDAGHVCTIGMTSMNADTRQFERLYHEHAQAIYAYCLRRTSRDEAKDATADVFAVAWRRFADVPNDDGALPWLYVVARNVLRDRSRSTRRRERLTLKIGSQAPEHVEGPEPQVIRSTEHEQVLAAIGKLPEKDQEIIRLVEWEGISRDRVAEMMYVSRAAIDKRMARAYKKLARHLGAGQSDVRTTPVPAEEGGEA
jgi:RNA polymerase sigma-70 factor (ECF subfamily)